MPRQKRILIDDGIYHIFNRGNNKLALFHRDLDFKAFIELIALAKKKYGITIFHYCIMTNHYHLLVQIGKAMDLSFFVHNFQLRYAQYSKRRYESTGHIFQERFRSPLITQESYYLQCGRYIERNSVKAGYVKNAEDYPFSSAAYYATGKRDSLITPNPYYLELERSPSERQKKYSAFLQIEEPYHNLLDKIIHCA